MIRAASLALAIALVAQPAAAFERMQRSQCRAGWDVFSSFVDDEMSAVSHRVTPDGWCRLTSTDPALAGANFTTLDWRAEGIAAFIDDRTPPTALAVRVDGVELEESGPVSRNNLVGSPRISGTLVLRALPETRQLLLEEARVTSSEGDELYLTGVYGRVDLSSFSMAQVSMGSMILEQMNGRIRLNGWVESVIVPDLDVELRGDPQAMRDAFLAELALIPDNLLEVGTRENITAFSEALPAPRGDLEVSIRATPGIGLLTLGRSLYMTTLMHEDGESEAFFPRILDDVKFGVIWTPDTDQTE